MLNKYNDINEVNEINEVNNNEENIKIKENCIICYELVDENEENFKFNCGHKKYLHHACIVNVNRCPLCRSANIYETIRSQSVEPCFPIFVMFLIFSFILLLIFLYMPYIFINYDGYNLTNSTNITELNLTNTCTC